ncbi:PQQ-binding-like beta-propeller repeat protein [Nocardiopsis sp. B62]|uniref:outer membrane protein assembly factor BamB family protein n=1 Tax=Nocardiopsis sp. B62 TaxID=2824874 RepID=UPI001FFCB4B0|nr:PQQ-binding-like beta-propeller repeat protein [Nocardiopsis sp. B62]
MTRSWPSLRWASAGVAVVFLVPLGACSVLGFGGVSVSHQELDGEWSDAAVPGTVSELAWEWTAEGYTGDLGVTALPGGVLLRMSHGVVALDGVTGEEQWSFVVQDEDVPVRTDVPSSGERVHVLYPEEAPGEESGGTDGDDSAGVPGRRVVLDGVTGEIVGDLEEEFTGDIEELGAFDLGTATDAGLFELGSEPLLSGRMLSDEDGSELWRTEDLFTCDGGSVDRADRPAVFPEALVVRAECGTDVTELVALDPEDGEVLWNLEGAGARPSADSVRAVGDLLALDQGGDGYWGEEFAEAVVLDPVTGEVVGDAAGTGEDWYPARTFGNGFLVSRRESGADAVGYELRRFDGQVSGTAAQAVETSSPGAYVIALEDAVVKFADSGDGGPMVSVAPWDGGEPFDVDVPESTDVALPSGTRQPEGRFEAVPGVVVLVDLSGAEGEGVKVLGFGE